MLHCNPSLQVYSKNMDLMPTLIEITYVEQWWVYVVYTIYTLLSPVHDAIIDRPTKPKH
jgi:hypothetical protein